MICKNCGAHFQDDLQDLHETIPEIYAAELKSQAKKGLKNCTDHHWNFCRVAGGWHENLYRF